MRGSGVAGQIATAMGDPTGAVAERLRLGTIAAILVTASVGVGGAAATLALARVAGVELALLVAAAVLGIAALGVIRWAAIRAARRAAEARAARAALMDQVAVVRALAGGQGSLLVPVAAFVAAFMVARAR